MFTLAQIQSLNELERGVYQYVIQHKNAVPYMRIRELAQESHVSTTTVLRFCKKMGCDGYTEFKLQMKKEVGKSDAVLIPDNLQEIRAFLDRFETRSYEQRLEDAASLIAPCNELLFVGVGSSGSICEYGARYFCAMGKFAVSISDPFFSIHRTDVQSMVGVFISVSGETYELIYSMRGLKESGGTCILITNQEHSTAASLADLVIPYYITSPPRSEGMDITSHVPALYIVETIGTKVHNRLGE